METKPSDTFAFIITNNFNHKIGCLSDRGLSGSKTGEVVSSEMGFRRLLAFPVVFLHILGLAHDGLLPETDLVEVGLVDVKTDLARGVLDCLLSVTLLGLEVLLGGQHCQLLLLDPLGVHLGLLGRATAIGSVSEIHSLGAVVLLEGELLGLLWLLGFLIEQLLDAQFGRNDFFSLGFLVLEVLLGVLQILGVAHVSVSASSFAGSVPEWREKYSLPVPDFLS